MGDHRPIHSDFRESFLNRAGSDQNLSWQETKAAPFVITEGKDKHRISISRDEFQAAQNSKDDTNPNKLSWSEFKDLLASKQVYHRPMTDCSEDSIPSHSRMEADVRQAVRQGISSQIKDTWPAQHKLIRKAIKDDKLSEVFPMLSEYMARVASYAHHSNQAVADICRVGCVVSLYEIEEFASPIALKDSTIKGFWKDVGKLLEGLLNKTVSKGRSEKWLSRVWKHSWDCRKVGFHDRAYSPSNYTLKQLVQRTNPSLAKRIDKMLSSASCPQPPPM